MKASRTVLILILLISFTTFSTKVSGEYLVNLIMEMLTTSVPCATPCLLTNLTGIVDDVVTNCHPLEFLSTNFSQYSNLSYSNWAQMIRQNTHDLICEQVKGFALCSVSQLQAYCGSNITHALGGQINRTFAYYGCGNSDKGLILQCLVQEGVDAIVEDCVNEVLGTPVGQTMLTHDYNKLLTFDHAPKICEFIGYFPKCVVGKLIAQKRCAMSVIKQIEDEVNDALDDLIGCNDPFDIRKDGLPCLGNPSLHWEILTCTASSEVQANLDSVDSSIGLPELLSTACGSLTLILDRCILGAMVNESNCQVDGWTLELYSAIVTPLRHFLSKQCPNNTTNSEANSTGYGICKTIYNDYPLTD